MRRIGVAVLAASIVLAGCGVRTSGLAFRSNSHFHFLAPAELAVVTTPVTIKWAMSGEPATSFAVFLDRAPIKPGQTVDAIANGDTSCLAIRHCPNRSYLAEHGVFSTDRQSLRLRNVPSRNDTADHLQVHNVTVVLLDRSGRRVSESYWQWSFRLRKPAT
jgi:hypothetical protein